MTIERILHRFARLDLLPAKMTSRARSSTRLRPLGHKPFHFRTTRTLPSELLTTTAKQARLRSSTRLCTDPPHQNVSARSGACARSVKQTGCSLGLWL
jgi:hypothetical protein